MESYKGIVKSNNNESTLDSEARILFSKQLGINCTCEQIGLFCNFHVWRTFSNRPFSYTNRTKCGLEQPNFEISRGGNYILQAKLS